MMKLPEVIQSNDMIHFWILYFYFRLKFFLFLVYILDECRWIQLVLLFVDKNIKVKERNFFSISYSVGWYVFYYCFFSLAGGIIISSFFCTIIIIINNNNNRSEIDFWLSMNCKSFRFLCSVQGFWRDERRERERIKYHHHQKKKKKTKKTQ